MEFVIVMTFSYGKRIRTQCVFFQYFLKKGPKHVFFLHPHLDIEYLFCQKLLIRSKLSSLVVCIGKHFGVYTIYGVANVLQTAH